LGAPPGLHQDNPDRTLLPTPGRQHRDCSAEHVVRNSGVRRVLGEQRP
jgi:hypothetical protein